MIDQSKMTSADPDLFGQQRLRLAYFSPLPPAPSGIADYSWELLPHLAQRADVTLFVPDPAEINAEVEQLLDIRSLSEYASSRFEFDLPVYQMGNSIHHDFVYRQALRYPGVIVLHDLFLHHLLATLAGQSNSFGAYVRDLAYILGQSGVDMAWDVRYGRRPYPLYTFPLNDRLVDHSLGIIVHSETVARLLRQNNDNKSIGVIPHLMPPQDGNSQRVKLPPPLGVTPDTVLFASVGQVTPGKRLDLALGAFARLLSIHPTSRYLIVGKVAASYNLEGVINDLGLADVVHCTGYVDSLDDFGDWVATADVVINLRQPTLGETSGAVLRAMEAGRPVIVLDHGWYGELPGDSCLQVPLHNEDALFEAMLLMADNPQHREEIGRQALVHVTKEHNPDSCAEMYVTFLNSLLQTVNGNFQDADQEKTPAIPEVKRL